MSNDFEELLHRASADIRSAAQARACTEAKLRDLHCRSAEPRNGTLGRPALLSSLVAIFAALLCVALAVARLAHLQPHQPRLDARVRAPLSFPSTNASAAGDAVKGTPITPAWDGTGDQGASLTPTTVDLPATTVPAVTNRLAGVQSITFSSPSEGWAVAVHSGEPGSFTIFRTVGGPGLWTVAPTAEVVGRDPGWSRTPPQILFADASNGWIFGRSLWSTHDGGKVWRQSSIANLGDGASVVALGAAAGTVHMAVTGAGRLQMFSSPVDVDSYIASSEPFEALDDVVRSEAFGLTASGGFYVPATGRGLQLRDGRWESWAPPCVPTVDHVVLNARARTVALLCLEATTLGLKATLRVSRDAGQSFADETPTDTDVIEPAFVAALGTDHLTLFGTLSVGTRLEPVVLGSFDRSASWSLQHLDSVAGAWTAVDTIDDWNAMAIVGTDLIRTSDGGRSWVRVTPLVI